MSSIRNFSFPKNERINSKKIIKGLFKSPSLFLYPFVAYYHFSPLSEEHPPTTKVLLSVSKKKFPKAVDRNKIKRQIREAYRLQKLALSPSQKTYLQYLGIVFVGKSIEPTPFLSKKMAKLLGKIQDGGKKF